MKTVSGSFGSVAVIPARGGSKRIPHKNKRLMAGKPLICWVIESAIAAETFDSVVVSTDDPEIAQISVGAGAVVQGLRPAHLAADETPSIDVVAYELSRMPECQLGVLIQPTSPLLEAADIRGLMSRLTSPGSLSVVSVVPSRVSPFTLFEAEAENCSLRTVVDEASQSNPSRWVELNGAMYGFRVDWLRRNRSFVGPDTVCYVMPTERSVDVDTEIDWILAERLLQSRKIAL